VHWGGFATPKIENFHLLVKSRPAGANPLRLWPISTKVRGLYTSNYRVTFDAIRFISYGRSYCRESARQSLTASFSLHPIETRSSADSDKPARRVYRSVKVTKHSTIPYIRYSNFVFTIFDFKKCRDLEIGVRSHSKSFKVAPFDRLCTVSYKCSLVTLSLKRTDFEIFDLKTTLGVRQGHWKCHRSIERIWLPTDVL